jgi:PPOX class probable F420-dependent enzyme
MDKTSVCEMLLGALPSRNPPPGPPPRGHAIKSPGAFEPFADQTYVLLTTYRRNGTGVGTPVHIAVVGDRAFVRTWDTAWKLKRIRNNPEVEIAPLCGARQAYRSGHPRPRQGARGRGVSVRRTAARPEAPDPARLPDPGAPPPARQQDDAHRVDTGWRLDSRTRPRGCSTPGRPRCPPSAPRPSPLWCWTRRSLSRRWPAAGALRRAW